MKIFNSIKWRLQIWYGLILVVVLAGFGFTAYQLEYNRQMRLVDSVLQHRFEMLAGSLHPPHRDGQMEQEMRPADELRGQNPTPEFHLSQQDILELSSTNFLGFYFTIQTRDGKTLAKSEKMPVGIDVEKEISNWRETWQNEIDNPHAAPVHIVAGNYHEILHVLPSGETILAGCSIVPEIKQLRHTAWILFGVGGIILIFGLAGGGWFVSRALRPIENISAAAVKISAGDLSQRINVAEAESELGQLAAVLNSTFARLEAAFAQQQQFTSDAAHELRTPVSVMLTQAQTALNRERTAPEYRETMAACQRAAQRMRRLIESLLALARLDAGQEVLNRLQFDFSKTVSDCVEMVKPMAEERGVKISTELSPLEITGDSDRLAQVVTNLLTNAIQYNLPDGEVRVKLESQNGLAVLIVADTGAGISSEDLPCVFERFYRADKSRSTGGNGLGLAISKAVVEAHGGTIEVASEENAGTTFIVRLPV
jgi:heavy metal sensor kinase